jgi:TolB-like protein
MMPPGTTLGPYRLVEKIGEGGMGEVYRAEDSRLHRTVAIKILSPRLATPDRIERFEAEARAASALNHPNILTIHDVGREGDTAYFAMEWVEGQTLRDLLRSGPVPLRKVVQLACQIAEGLAKAHAAGIVHRDLKPENVMVTTDGLAKIVDFGLAKLGAPASSPISDAESTITRAGGTEPGLVMGTIGYMSPEQASGRPADYRSDQFSLGLLIYELATRTRPFERPTSAQSLAATIDADPPSIETLKPDVPPHLAAIVARLLSKDPAERYESTRDLARDLKSLTASSSNQTALPVTRAPRVSRRALIAIAAVVLLIGAATAAWFWRARSSATPAEPERPLLVVRPFRSLSPDQEQGYFAAGMTEEIRGQLSQVSSLRLLSRNALDGYDDDVPRAVRELGIRNIVDGSIRVEGRRVRVSAELVDASNQQTLWSNKYDRDLADVLAVQSEIAQQIAGALTLSLSPSERQRIEKRPTQNLEAYSLYLQTQSAPEFDRARNLEAIEVLRKALTLDPAFARAQARIGFRLVMMGYYDDASYVDKGLAEAQGALRLDPSLPFGHFVLGTGYGMKGMDAQARQAFLRALELDPNNAGAMANLSIQELTHGRLDEAVYWGRRGFLLSGKRGSDFYHLVIPILNLRADRETRILLEEGERRSPTFSRVQMMLAALELFEGHADRALSRADALVASQPQNEEVKFFRADIAFLLDAPDIERWLTPLMEHGASNNLWVAETVRMRYAYALARRGETVRAAALVDEAERVARKKIDAGSETPALRVEMAAAAALRKDTDSALEWLERAVDAGYRDYDFIDRDPIFRAQLGTDTRLAALVERMRRDVDAQRERARQRGLLELESLLGPAKE